MEPVGMTNASTTNARKMNARMKATRIDSTVSLTLLSCAALPADFAAMRASYATRPAASKHGRRQMGFTRTNPGQAKARRREDAKEKTIGLECCGRARFETCLQLILFYVGV